MPTTTQQTTFARISQDIKRRERPKMVSLHPLRSRDSIIAISKRCEWEPSHGGRHDKISVNLRKQILKSYSVEGAVYICLRGCAQ